MAISASALRHDIYKQLDKVAESGIPLEIERKGIKLAIVRVDSGKKLDRLVKHDVLNCDAEDLLNLDWSGEWKNDLP